MKQILTTILISVTITTLGLYVFYNHVQVEPIEYVGQEGMLGATVTTINATDKIKDSRAVINTNFANLNTDKMEVGTTTLPLVTTLSNLATIGTITTGIWNGTAINVTQGGTGSTTLAQYQLVVGSSTNAVYAIPIGTAGQVLQSNGAGAIPSFESGTVDESLNYDWTGLHTFAETTDLSTTTQWGLNGGLIPTGSITAYATTTAPLGWLAADGSEVSSTTYANLFAVIGYSYGGSPGGDFNLPNLNGRGVIGYGSATTTIDTMGETGGEDEHVQTISEMPAHTHYTAMSGETESGYQGSPYRTHNVAPNANPSSSTGSGTAFNVLDPFLVLRYIIKY